MDKITLINWRTHKHSVIELAPTITSIIGPSSHGKTNVLRGIDWVYSNRPSGTGFIRRGEKECEVAIDNVSHTRTQTKNEYRIDGHKDPFKALRQAVPEQVTKALNLTEDNIQTQRGKIFLLEDSPGVVAEKLSTLIDVNDAKRAMQHIKSENSALKDKYNATKLILEQDTKAVALLKQYQQVDSELLLIEQKRVRIDELKQKGTLLTKALQNAVKCSEILSSFPDTSALEPALKLLSEYKEIVKLKEKAAVLGTAIHIVKRNEWHTDINIQELRDELKEVELLINNQKHLSSAVNVAKSSYKELQDSLSQKERIEKEKNEVMGDTCPLCGKSQR